VGADRPSTWCAALARALDEPLPGTASVAARWVCIEHRGTWPHEISQHRDDSVRDFIARARSTDWRPVLVRRPGRRPSEGPTRIFFTDTAPPAPRTTVLSIVDPDDLASITFPTADEPLPGETVADPMLLVCTHGRKDRCCAVDGRALARAIAATGESDVWESTHLGGHRFAPTALVLPTGYLYGRLDAAAAIAAYKAAAVGEVEPELCRGRSTWTQPGQVAELAVRAETGLRGAEVLRVEPSADDVTAPVQHVTVTATDGLRWSVSVSSVARPGNRPVSCGAAALPVTALHASRLRRLA
jgi:hypothetical protein